MTVPDELPPDKLQIEDIVKGKGPAAKKGDKVSMQYVGVTWSTSVEFDASWDARQPFTLTLGKGKVIQGWDKGVPGMRKGGRRQLTIPADMAYGAQGSPPNIGPNECLRFIIDLVKLERSELRRRRLGVVAQQRGDGDARSAPRRRRTPGRRRRPRSARRRAPPPRPPRRRRGAGRS